MVRPVVWTRRIQEASDSSRPTEVDISYFETAGEQTCRWDLPSQPSSALSSSLCYVHTVSVLSKRPLSFIVLSKGLFISEEAD